MKVAVTSGSAEMVQLLFDLGAKAKSHTGAECMFLAATKGDFDLVNLFLKAGGDVNAEERVSAMLNDTFSPFSCVISLCDLLSMTTEVSS